MELIFMRVSFEVICRIAGVGFAGGDEHDLNLPILNVR